MALQSILAIHVERAMLVCYFVKLVLQQCSMLYIDLYADAKGRLHICLLESKVASRLIREHTFTVQLIPEDTWVPKERSHAQRLLANERWDWVNPDKSCLHTRLKGTTCWEQYLQLHAKQLLTS